MKSETIWLNGELIPYADANIHILSHLCHYGSGVFEGIRAYETHDGRTAIFRGRDHNARLFESAHIYRMHEKGRVPAKLAALAAEKQWNVEIPFTRAETFEAMKATIRANGFSGCYVRPLVFRGSGGLGVNPFPNRIEVMIATWEWGAYLGAEALEQGVDVCVSSWTRLRPNTMPAGAKAAANYMNGQLCKMEALVNGYVEGIGLDANGLVSEGSGENLFIVKRDRLYTSPLAGSILGGITRDTICTLAREHGLEVVEQQVPRELLYTADELFFCGTAAEVTPIRSVDQIQVGAGSRGPITEKLQSHYLDLVTGKAEDKWGFLDYVDEA